ncbi:MAG: hypothetical protein WBH45_10755, partial [Acidobacteriaceae bacterium]
SLLARSWTTFISVLMQLSWILYPTVNFAIFAAAPLSSPLRPATQYATKAVLYECTPCDGAFSTTPAQIARLVKKMRSLSNRLNRKNARVEPGRHPIKRRGA